jgi:hypothetical protein
MPIEAEKAIAATARRVIEDREDDIKLVLRQEVEANPIDWPPCKPLAGAEQRVRKL